MMQTIVISSIIMKNFKAVCPHCEGELEIPAGYLGREVKCSNCRTEFVAEPHLASSAKKPKARKPSEIGGTGGARLRLFVGFSLKVTPEELIFHTYCRIVGWAGVAIGALLLLFVIVNKMASDGEGGLSALAGVGSFSLALSCIISGALHLGGAQLIKLVHSMAYNIQVMKEAQDHSS